MVAQRVSQSVVCVSDSQPFLLLLLLPLLLSPAATPFSPSASAPVPATAIASFRKVEYFLHRQHGGDDAQLVQAVVFRSKHNIVIEYNQNKKESNETVSASIEHITFHNRAQSTDT